MARGKRVDLAAEQFASFRHDFNRKDSSGLTIDYGSGFKAAMTVKLRSDGSTVLSLDSAAASGDRIILSSSSPNISIRITQATMAGIPPAPDADYYDYDLLLRPDPDAPGYDTDNVVGGLFKVSAGVTEGVP